jgi:hypothetical protein
MRAREAGATATHPPPTHSQTQARKYRLPKGKVLIRALISEDLYKELISVAPNIYGKSHGAISFVVEEALKQYLSLLTEAKEVKFNPRMSVRKVYEQVKAKIREILKSPFTPVLVPSLTRTTTWL